MSEPDATAARLQTIVTPTCDVRLRRHEEKETDVAIASAIVEAAATRECSAVALVSSDTDLVPALQTAHRIHPGLRRYCFFPPYRSNRAFDACTDGCFRIAPTQLPRHRLPDSIAGAGGGTVVKPDDW
jgi:hypothetical protein